MRKDLQEKSSDLSAQRIQFNLPLCALWKVSGFYEPHEHTDIQS
jgi:hypothetical protein